jgi:protocatechuate 3,4-dioxygenase beta subunit
MKTLPFLTLTLFTFAAFSQPSTLTYSGNVLDTSGNSIQGATVELYQQGRPPAVIRSEMELKSRVTTAADGKFTFQCAAAHTLVLVTKTGLAPAWVQNWNFNKDIKDERIVLGPPAGLGGKVVDESTNPVANADVFVSVTYLDKPNEEGGGSSWYYMSGKAARQTFSTRSDAAGKFAIANFPTNAMADLGVQVEGKVLKPTKREYVSPDTMRCRGGDTDVMLVVEPAGMVEGKVLAKSSGQPLAGVSLNLFPTTPGSFGEGIQPVESGPDGQFRFPGVAAGSYNLQASFGTNQVPDWVAEQVSVNVEAGQSLTGVEVSAIKGGFLQVTVLSKSDRKPVANVGVNAFKNGFQAGGASDTNGVLLLHLAPGEYQVSAYRENTRSEQQKTTIETDKSSLVEFELSEPNKISGTVTDVDGKPVAGLELSLFPNWGRLAADLKTDAEGHYSFPWNPQRFGGMNERFCLVARDLTRNLAVAEEIEESTTKMDLRLQPGLSVSGRVQDVDGKPLTKASVRLFLWSGNSGSQFGEKPTKVDAEGKFRIAALPPGRKYSMDATALGYGSANQQLQSEDASTNSLDLEPFVLNIANLKLAGQVLDSEDKPVAGASLYMYGQGQPNASARSDAKGFFRFEHVCEGSLNVSANARNAYGNTRADGGDTNVVIRLGDRSSVAYREQPKRPSLKGKPLPDLASVNFAADSAPSGKRLLLCLFDVDQRPSRRFIRQLAEQFESLKQKDVAVLGLQAAVTTPEALKEWKDSNPVPFPVGHLTEKNPKTKWASDVESLPWLILTDADRRVTAEGFELDDLDSKLKP